MKTDTAIRQQGLTNDHEKAIELFQERGGFRSQLSGEGWRKEATEKVGIGARIPTILRKRQIYNPASGFCQHPRFCEPRKTIVEGERNTQKGKR